MGAVVRGPGDGERYAIGVGEVEIKATEQDTGGTMYLSEMTVPPGFPGPVAHRHRQLTDMFYVLEGVLTIRLEDDTRAVGAGTFVCVPPGVVHTFSNPGEEPVRILNLSTPGGWEDYVRELGEAARSGELTPETMASIASRYDFEPA